MSRQPYPGLEDDELKQALRDDWQGEHDPIGYWDARKAIFNSIDGDGRQVQCLYTGETVTYFVQPLPHQGALDHAVPLTRCPSDARDDLHHIFPVTPEARSARVQLHYGDVLVPVWAKGGSMAGPSSQGWPVFEVRQARRGRVARAVFYVATMYDDISLDDEHESILREWHHSDLVTDPERERCERISEAQGSINPFVIHPDLTERISNF